MSKITIPNNGEISLYFHLPFCQKKCDYCHFYVLPNKENYKALLLEALLKEIEQKKELFRSKKICSIYFGGGTPSLVAPSFIEQILQAISLHSPIDNVEITLELNPEQNDLDLLQSFFSTGINRLSVGVQSFQDNLLKILNRSHTSQEIDLALNNAFLAGFENISIDLIYDLPHQTIEDWQTTIDKALTFPVSHISLYNLSIEPHTVFYKYRKKIEKAMPEPKRSLAMFEYAKKKFQEDGFHSYEISAFCKDGKYSKHNVGYWLQREHLGFGPSAFSLLGGRRFRNVANIHKYSKFIEKNSPPVDFEEQLDPDAFLKESFALHLRLTEGFDLNLFQKRFGLLPLTLKHSLENFIQESLIICDQTHIKLSSNGLLLHDSIAAEII